MAATIDPETRLSLAALLLLGSLWFCPARGGEFLTAEPRGAGPGEQWSYNHPDVRPRPPADPLTLQARMTCRCEDDRHISGSWQFGLNGQMRLHFDSENGHCRVDHPGGRWMKEKWENDRAVTEFLKKVSVGDCPAWLQAFMVRWEKRLKTSASQTTDPPYSAHHGPSHRSHHRDRRWGSRQLWHEHPSLDPL
ncbi:UL16-binding protein 3-like [Dama dama]|uniref:UL16-binding protein 3-like n=1 Tax=Dama dama TaxID=30532 RepID=UPI002A37224F|nr:UL16-binding protein 3-like [Dama dama]